LSRLLHVLCGEIRLRPSSSVFLLHSPPAFATILPDGRLAEGPPEGPLPAPASRSKTRRASRAPSCHSHLTPIAPAMLSPGLDGRAGHSTSTALSKAGRGALSADKTMAYACTGRHLPSFRHNSHLKPMVTAT
jgi:hypothetical protein